jgi:hypothetical protein
MQPDSRGTRSILVAVTNTQLRVAIESALVAHEYTPTLVNNLAQHVSTASCRRPELCIIQGDEVGFTTTRSLTEQLRSTFPSAKSIIVNVGDRWADPEIACGDSHRILTVPFSMLKFITAVEELLT